jgi:hypothetical protein
MCALSVIILIGKPSRILLGFPIKPLILRAILTLDLIEILRMCGNVHRYSCALIRNNIAFKPVVK